jgi:hypothetical protein
MAAQRDFQEQKGRLQEELEAAGREVIFYPKFHYELNFIENFWCSCKAYTRDHCTFTIKAYEKSSRSCQISINCDYQSVLPSLYGGDGLAVDMSGQHVCVLQVRVPLLPLCGYSGV